MAAEECEPFDAFIRVRSPSTTLQVEKKDEEDDPSVIVVEIGRGKKQQMQYLHQVLPAAETFGSHWFNGTGRRVLLIDEEGDYDASIGILMLLLARFFDDNRKEFPTQSSVPSEWSFFLKFRRLRVKQLQNNSYGRGWSGYSKAFRAQILPEPQ